MKIASLALRLPSLRISNEDIVATVARGNSHLSTAALGRYQREVTLLLKKAGARDRYVRDRERGETAIMLVCEAARDAMGKASLSPKDIDLLIYCGVGRGFIEPANAYFVAASLGLKCSCFDVLDACMSWVRSLEIASHYLVHEGYRNILIVNAEFSMYEYGYPDGFKVSGTEALQYTFPAYTIGEGATATVVSRSSDPWSFRFASMPEMAAFCTIPLNGYRDFCERDDEVSVNGPHRFVAFGGKLFSAATEAICDMVRCFVPDVTVPDLWFPHVAADRPYRAVAQSLGIDPVKVYSTTFGKYGNLASGSIPAAMSSAIETGLLVRGMRVVLCPASAGMSIALVEFTF